MRLTTTHKAVVTLILALIAAVLIYLVVKPPRQDLCSSEILINGRGGAVNIQTRTVTLGGEGKPVPLDKMTNDSQLAIDQLSRWCREHQAKLISSEEYYARTERLLKPAAQERPAAARVPLFKGSIGVTGLVDNRAFRRFVEANIGKVVRLDLTVDAGAYNPLGVHFLDRCYSAINDAGEEVSHFPAMMDNLFGQRFHLIETEEDVKDYAEPNEKEKQISCGPDLEFRSNGRTLNWSSAGPGLTFTRIDGFYRVSADYMGAGQSFRFEEVTGSIADYAEPQN